MKSITITPDKIGTIELNGPATVSEKYDGIQGRWSGRSFTTREGKDIKAPAWFIKQLPEFPCTGELWMGRGTFQEVQSVVLRDTPDDRWHDVTFMVFASMHDKKVRTTKNVEQVEQHDFNDIDVDKFCKDVLAAEGEGLVIISGGTFVKVKPSWDEEATVIGYNAGTGNRAGLVGSLLVKNEDGHKFSVGSGMTLADCKHPPKIGERITYAFKGRTASGKPRFPTFLRVRPVGV